MNAKTDATILNPFTHAKTVEMMNGLTRKQLEAHQAIVDFIDPACATLDDPPLFTPKDITPKPSSSILKALVLAGLVRRTETKGTYELAAWIDYDKAKEEVDALAVLTDVIIPWCVENELQEFGPEHLGLDVTTLRVVCDETLLVQHDDDPANDSDVFFYLGDLPDAGASEEPEPTTAAVEEAHQAGASVVVPEPETQPETETQPEPKPAGKRAKATESNAPFGTMRFTPADEEAPEVSASFASREGAKRFLQRHLGDDLVGDPQHPSLITTERGMVRIDGITFRDLWPTLFPDYARSRGGSGSGSRRASQLDRMDALLDRLEAVVQTLEAMDIVVD